MQKLLRLCLWQAIIIGILTTHFPVSAEESRSIRMLGPKSSDVFPYERYGPITSKDTLWNIAIKVRPDNRLTVYQVMQALYQENPQAFADNNINHLVESTYLKIPSFNDMMAVNTSNAKRKSESDSKAWQKSQEKITKKQVNKRPSVKKEDLDTVKTEINDQLKKIDGQQQERLDNIQNDISDSIDGLQAILKENEDLRQRLSAFNDTLGVMQDEVAKGKEIKLQMDDMIKLQQALLAKAEAREKQLLLERQQAELDEQDITTSLWFKIVMGTLPASLILGLIAFLFKRRQQASDEVFFDELSNKKQANSIKNEKEAEDLSLDEFSLDDDLSLDEELDLTEELSLDEELTLDDELSLDDELGLDDDLSIDLIESDDELLDDNVIHLDDDDGLDDLVDLEGLDDLDDLDDLEDILLDDDIEGDVLEGGELNQGDLDSLLSGLDDDTSAIEEESEILEGGQLNQDDLNDLLGGLDETDPEELEPELATEASSEEPSDVTDPDDIDALLEQAAQSAPEKSVEPALGQEPATAEVEDEESVDVTDPDDIDALLEQAAQSAPEKVVEPAPAPEVAKAEESVDVTDPDDIDALLEQAAQSAPEKVVESAPAPEVAKAEESVDVTDPDDIDALLEQAAQSAPEKAVEPAPAPEVAKAKADESVDVTDPDDIDALLEQAAQSEPEKPAESTSAPELTKAKAEESVDVTDPDDIDALLEQAAQSAPDKPAESASAPELAKAKAEESVDVTDPDDIDALLEQAAQSAPEKPAPAAELTKAEESVEVTDPDDIDALLDSIVDSASATPVKVETNQNENHEIQASAIAEETEVIGQEQTIQNEIAENEAKIAEFTAEYVTPFLTADFSEILAKEEQSDLPAEDLTVNDATVAPVKELDEELDIDALIAENGPEQMVDELVDSDIGDSLTESGDMKSQQVNSDSDKLTEKNTLETDIANENITELTTDFSNEEVLAELLNESDDPNVIGEDIAETPLDVIEELDDVDFDELLANIEEETANYPEDEAVEYEFEDIGDDLITVDSGVEIPSESEALDANKDYVSVDDLLTESLEEAEVSEPYEKTNIDVGLGQFAENEAGIDVDEDGSVSSKLDLAKMYIQMSDEENAQVILQEVIEKGDGVQQAEAKSLLDTL